jgi:flagellar biosynthesis/type III secretory pathway protein FliH
MPEAFRSLASMLRVSPESAHDESHTVPHGDVHDPPADVRDEGAWQSDAGSVDVKVQLMSDIRVFRARIAEGVEAALDALLADIAADVLARELRMAPADLQHIVDCALTRYQSDEPLRVRVHPDEVNSIACAIPVVADDDLRTGDAMIELRTGTVQATLGIRLADVLSAERPCS